MSEEMPTSDTDLRADVVVIGGGLTGMSSAIHLARGGMSVICLEPHTAMPPTTGESLDWSAPGLFADLGLPMEDLLASEAATSKRHIVLNQQDGSHRQYAPGAWLAKRPWNVEVQTMHLHRPHVHTAMEHLAGEERIQILHERAAGFAMKGDRLVSVTTSTGRQIHALWFVDASGAAASLLGREFNLPVVTYGPRKVALWAHLPAADPSDGTNLYMLHSSRKYMEWIWEIPIQAGVSSVGYVAPGAAVKSMRSGGMTNAEIFLQQLGKFPALRALIPMQGALSLNATSFLCRTFVGVCGPNWIIAGEAASQSDPITGNGVTAALRHAEEASGLLLRYRSAKRIPLPARRAYSLRVLQMGRFFNSLIENIYYQPELRACLGIFAVGRIYTVPAWLANLAYSRLRPASLIGTLAFGSVLTSLRMLAWTSRHVGGRFSRHAA